MMGNSGTAIPDGIYALADPESALTAFNMNNEFNLFGKKTYLIGHIHETFMPINDAPVEKAIVKKKGSWLANLITGIVVTAALAALAVATVVTGGAALAVVCLAGAAIGAGVVTASVAITDKKSGNARSWGEFLGNLAFGATIGALAGATIYGLWTALPAASQAVGLQVSMWTGLISPLTYSTIPAIVTISGYGLMGFQGVRFLNEISSIGSGQNWLLENVFGQNQEFYDSATMLADLLTMSYMQLAHDNAGLAQSKKSKLPSYADDILDDIDEETWDKGSSPRGKDIDNAEKIKNNLGDNFPVVDRLDDDVLISNKSYDISCDTYQKQNKLYNALKRDLDKLYKFTSKTWGGITINITDYNSKQLNVILPSTSLSTAQIEELQRAKDYANSLGMTIKVYITN